MSTFRDSSSQLPWGAFGAIVIGFLALIGGQILGAALVVAFLVYGQGQELSTALSVSEDNLTLVFISYVLGQAIALAVVYGFIRSRGGSWRDLGFRGFDVKRAVGVVALGFIGFVITAVTVLGLVEVLFPHIDMTAEQDIGFLSARATHEVVFAFLALVVLAPVMEEVVFRGLLLPALAKLISIVPAVILTSIVFGLLHPPEAAMVMIGIFSLFLSWAYIRTNSLWPAILLHSIKNLIAFISIFISGVSI